MWCDVMCEQRRGVQRRVRGVVSRQEVLRAPGGGAPAAVHHHPARAAQEHVHGTGLGHSLRAPLQLLQSLLQVSLYVWTSLACFCTVSAAGTRLLTG